MRSEAERAERQRASEGGGGGGEEPVHLLQVSLPNERVNRRSARTNKLYFNSPTDFFFALLCLVETVMSGSYCRSLYPYSGEQHQQGLSFDAGEIIRVVQALPGGWWEGERDGHRGWFPSSYVQVLEVSTQKLASECKKSWTSYSAAVS